MDNNNRITDVSVNKIDATNEIRYTALIDNRKYIEYVTDGVKRKHMSENIWLEYVKGIMNNLDK